MKWASKATKGVKLRIRDDIWTKLYYDLTARRHSSKPLSSTVGGCIADLCSFAAGDELYVIRPHAAWRCFGDARLAFDSAVCIGVEANSGERVLLAPRDDRSLREGERLVVMASSFQAGT